MIYNDFQGLKLSALGMGNMRLPVLDGNDNSIDVDTAKEMIDFCMKSGINYYDTAYGYHGGNSELVVGEQLKKCQVDSFDFYLFHNVFDYLIEQKKNGRIRHLGFSAHGDIDCITRFLEAYGKDMEFGHQSIPSVTVTLSGMSNMEELKSVAVKMGQIESDQFLIMAARVFKFS